MQEMQREHLLKNIRRVLRGGGRISVYGWKPSNHDKYTKSYTERGRVQFIEKNSKANGVTGDFTVCTPFVSHSDSLQIKNKCSVYSKTVAIGVLKKILRNCQDLIFAEAESDDKKTNIFIEDEVTSTAISIEELESKIYQSEVLVDIYDRLASCFKEEVNGDKEAVVGTKTLGKILRDLGFEETTRDLVSAKWLVPHTAEGKSKIGGYSAGEKLLERMNHEKREEPSDPIEKAQFLRERRPFLEEKYREALAIADGYKAQIDRCDAADELMRQLENI